MNSFRTFAVSLITALALVFGASGLSAQSPDPALGAQVATSQKFFDRLNAGDMQGWLQTMAANVVTHEPVGTPPNVGHDGVMAWAARNQQMGFKAVVVTVDSIFPAKSETIIRWTTRFTLADGSEVSIDGVDQHRFDDQGKIVEVRGYFDPTPLMAAMKPKG